jgi:chromosome segregation ATPase
VLPTAAGRPPLTPGPNPGAEYFSVLQAQLMAADENRKALEGQVVALKKELRDRDSSLERASHEVEQTWKNVQRTRDDVTRWKGEMEDLRDRIRKLEEERARLLPLVEGIIHQLDRDSGAYNKLPSLPRALK